MKLRVRILRQTSRVELSGEEPSLKELSDHIREKLLSAHGLSAEFSLSLNGSELLSDSGQTLSSCGIVSGDLICVLLPESAAGNPPTSTCSSSSSSSTSTCSSSSSTSTSTCSSSSSSSTSTCSSSSSTFTSSTKSTCRTNSSSEKQQPAAMTSTQPCSSSSRPAAALSQEEAEVSDSGPPPVCSWEPMLCSEAEGGQAPLSLELLLHSAQPCSPSDAVMVAGHLLMLETGFLPQGCEQRQMPAGWRSPAGVYKLQYSHPLCENSRVMVLAVCMGPELVINATLKVEESVDTVPKLCVKPCSYVTPERTGGSAAAAFTDLKKLSRLFKDQLAYPLIAAARAAMSLPVAFGLAALPPELLLRVLRLLDVRSLLHLSSTCRLLQASAADSSLWRHLCRRDFSRETSVFSERHVSRPTDTDWRELYKKYYKVNRELRRPFHRHPRDFFVPPMPPMPLPPLPFPLHPPLPPGIIGGEYDQRPGFPRLVLPRPRYDPIHGPRDLDGRPPRLRPGGRSADIRRGFI